MNTDNPTNPTPDNSPGKSGAAPDTEQLRQDASAAAETAKRDLQRVRDEAENSVRDISRQAQAQLGRATEKAKTAAADQKDVLAERISGVAKAVSKVADELRDEQPSTAEYASSIAGGMRRLSENIRDRDIDELVAMAQDLGRRQPATFMGAAALAGFAASRFLFASSRRNRSGDGAASSAATDFGSASPTYPDGGRRAAARDAMEGSVK